ncbi:DUF3089 domain-containing protein [Nocardia sp. 004]|uniref:DUF3089 domain-containing protein n=1 Tax=Nocardia sp. 004 TaxID=3385978 RepID=UPI00399FB2D7
MRFRAVIAMAVAGIAAATATAVGPVGAARAEEPADGQVTWLCRPDMVTDPCRGDASTTIQGADGETTVDRPSVRAHDVDCFYVYPTVSTDPALNARPEATPAVTGVARLQAAQFSQLCDVYAPVYRQRTLFALQRGPLSTDSVQAGAEEAYSDVVRAWRQYLERDNHGRGIVLIGHSQGTLLLRRLIAEQIETDPVADGRIVSALLAGGNVVVPENSTVGGDFTSLPLCGSATQIHCALAWSAFGEIPPATTRFGAKPTTASAHPAPYGPGYEIACTNPASLEHNDRALVTTLRPGVPPAGIMGLADVATYGPQLPPPATPWVQPASGYRAQCVHTNGAHVLMITADPGMPPLNAFPDANWGLHVTDINIVLGDLIAVVDKQIAAYTAAHR